MQRNARRIASRYDKQTNENHMYYKITSAQFLFAILAIEN